MSNKKDIKIPPFDSDKASSAIIGGAESIVSKDVKIPTWEEQVGRDDRESSDNSDS